MSEVKYGPWIEHTGDVRPVSGNDMVRILMDDSVPSVAVRADNLYWGKGAGITHYAHAIDENGVPYIYDDGGYMRDSNGYINFGDRVRARAPMSHRSPRHDEESTSTSALMDELSTLRSELHDARSQLLHERARMEAMYTRMYGLMASARDEYTDSDLFYLVGDEKY